MIRLVSLLVATALLLGGCSYVVETPYVCIKDGVYAVGNTVKDHGEIRERLPSEQQALQFITDDKGVDLMGGRLAFYTGTLYSLSNYRKALLDDGYKVDTITRTCDVLDTTLKRGDDRIRLIYQRSGTIRILFKKNKGERHIKMKVGE